jgi:hypothetical protein
MRILKRTEKAVMATEQNGNEGLLREYEFPDSQNYGIR